ncbi:hypothetical protein EYC55_15060 [Xanthomonas oryzae]|nr:hypothetical protein EYC55_15060 [Xanthomonas oryzae]QBG99454.1 hypothetical protein EYC56_08920 [Xanthomonas oryzae]
MICSSEKRFFTSNLLGIGNWTPNRCATQNRGDVAAFGCGRVGAFISLPLSSAAFRRMPPCLNCRPSPKHY